MSDLEILRDVPDLTIDDIRACLAFHLDPGAGRLVIT